MGRVGWLVVALGLAACEQPSYELHVEYTVFDAEGLAFRLDGEPVAADTIETALGLRASFGFDRVYRSYAAARQAPPIAIEAVRDGVVVWTYDQRPDLCTGFDECGRIVEADYNDCLESDGQPGGLCSSLGCVDEDGPCASVVSGPPVR